MVEQTVKVRLSGQQGWARAKVILASGNAKSLFLAGEELPSLPGGGMTAHPHYGKVLALLAGDDGTYAELVTGARYEVQFR